MDIVYEEANANAMTNGSMASSSMHTTLSSAHLAEKLKKLLHALAMTEAMDIDVKELKKFAFMPQLHANQALTPSQITGENTAPEVKKSCNDETPLCMSK